MDAQRFWHLSVMSSWIFVFLLPSVFSQMEPQIHLESRVFVAFTGHELQIECMLEIPENHTSDILKCSDPFQTQICNYFIPTGQPVNVTLTLELKNLISSGEYSCQYKTATVYWFLRLRDKGYKEPVDNTEFIVVAVLTVILLVFSVIGSAFVFRGYRKECITENGNTSKKQEQNRAKKQEKEVEEDNVDVMTAPCASLYASLDPRTRSVYDVLDCPPANTDQRKAKPKKKEPKNTTVQSTKPQSQDVFECVYENF